ncbi:peptidase M23 [Christiangramia fulva]|uniref:Peptidase M23 n=1 Tax=Christiangramia fulva TaxID=2126553 RepID=A0A2R3Z2R9_9FLAO|nr:peptidoglycan DD-metalloendopeptidase family protein [Christiangramia fulva]AVR44539.1 peptidase M23 [Christiangramia fulva]
MVNRKIIGIFLMLCLIACSKIEKTGDLLKGLSAREKYQKENDISDELFELWNSQIDSALNDKIKISLPYREIGGLMPRDFSVYSYEGYFLPGEIIKAKMQTDSSETKIFIQLYKADENDPDNFQKIAQPDDDSPGLNHEINEKGLYKIIFQPEIEAHTPFKLEIEKSPAYIFPVVNGRNEDIGSYFGDMREGGKRDHKGLDIFAKKGTAVVAAVNGRIIRTGEEGLGGKQVWLRDPKRHQSLYYAHLDSIIPDLSRVKTGDTLGFVGNTGNAVNTPSHLHFRIYKRSRGAIDPIGFVYQTEHHNLGAQEQGIIPPRVIVTGKTANFRNKPSNDNSRLLKTAKQGEKLKVLGKAEDWFHVRDSLNQSMFIHESLVIPAD